MISGSLLLSKDISSNILDFYKRRAIRIVFPIFFWTIIYLSWSILYKSEPLGKYLIKNIVSGHVYFHLWYLYMIVGLYLAAPFIQKMTANLDLHAIKLFLFVVFTLSSVDGMASAFSGTSGVTFLSMWPYYIGYFVAGHYLCSINISLQNNVIISVIIFCGAIIATITGVLLNFIGASSWKVMYSNMNPFVIVMALSVFVLFKKNKQIEKMFSGLSLRVVGTS